MSSFTLTFAREAALTYAELEIAAKKSLETRTQKNKTKNSKLEGLFKQVYKTLSLLRQNPKHPSLKSHEFSALAHPFDPNKKVWEVYAQNNTPDAYRIFYCYGPQKDQITLIAITPHS